LRAIHSRRVAHCDIKSENVLLDSKFNVKIVDFGYARYFVDEHCHPIAYDNSDGIGSLKCSAPELMNSVGKGAYHGD
jgi:serine/threonine protein kinase